MFPKSRPQFYEERFEFAAFRPNGPLAQYADTLVNRVNFHARIRCPKSNESYAVAAIQQVP